MLLFNVESSSTVPTPPHISERKSAPTKCFSPSRAQNNSRNYFDLMCVCVSNSASPHCLASKLQAAAQLKHVACLYANASSVNYSAPTFITIVLGCGRFVAYTTNFGIRRQIRSVCSQIRSFSSRTLVRKNDISITQHKRTQYEKKNKYIKSMPRARTDASSKYDNVHTRSVRNTFHRENATRCSLMPGYLQITYIYKQQIYSIVQKFGFF